MNGQTRLDHEGYLQLGFLILCGHLTVLSGAKGANDGVYQNKIKNGVTRMT